MSSPRHCALYFRVTECSDTSLSNVFEETICKWSFALEKRLVVNHDLIKGVPRQTCPVSVAWTGPFISRYLIVPPSITIFFRLVKLNQWTGARTETIDAWSVDFHNP